MDLLSLLPLLLLLQALAHSAHLEPHLLHALLLLRLALLAEPTSKRCHLGLLLVLLIQVPEASLSWRWGFQLGNLMEVGMGMEEEVGLLAFLGLGFEMCMGGTEELLVQKRRAA
jgi:hypothetical protein